jgi:protein arginine kinase activator
MLCEACQTNPARVHLTDVSNNKKKEVHLCDDCAQAQGVTVKSYMSKASASAEVGAVESAVEVSTGADGQKCPQCNISYRQFRSAGKFGCPHDYVIFKPKLDDLLEKIHGRNEHVGKVPSRATDQIAREHELRNLRDDLDVAVREEAYERAAELRDRIYRLEER